MKKLTLLITLLFMPILTGCLKNYEYSDEVGDSIAEYMAELLLKYDNSHEYGLIPQETLDLINYEGNEVIEKPADEDDNETVGKPTTTPDSDIPQGDTDEEVTTKYTLSQVIGEQDFDIQYSGYEIMDGFTDENFSLIPIQGNQLLVVSFTVMNRSDQKTKLNLIKSDISYQLDINIGKIHKPQLTIVENDLQYFNLDIEAGKTKKAILIFQISKGLDISQINLIASKGEKTEIIELK